MTVTGQYSWSQTFRGKKALLCGLYGHLATLLAEGRLGPFPVERKQSA